MLSTTEIGLLIGLVSTSIISLLAASGKYISKSSCLGSTIEFKKQEMDEIPPNNMK
jgi:hypothetical protein